MLEFKIGPVEYAIIPKDSKTLRCKGQERRRGRQSDGADKGWKRGGQRFEPKCVNNCGAVVENVAGEY